MKSGQILLFGLHKRMLSLLGSKNTNLKLEIEPHRDQTALGHGFYLGHADYTSLIWQHELTHTGTDHRDGHEHTCPGISR